MKSNEFCPGFVEELDTVPAAPLLYVWNAKNDFWKLSGKGRIFFTIQREKGYFFVDVYSEIWGAIEKPGTIMDTQAFTKDDHQGKNEHREAVQFCVANLPEFLLWLMYQSIPSITMPPGKFSKTVK